MAAQGLIGPYDSTASFVAELQKHLKIMKVCPSTKLRDCWPYEKVTLLDGKEWEISKTQTCKHLKMEDSDTADYSSPNVGIITGDGTPMILSYNTKCEALDPVKSYTWSTEDNKPVSNATASCVAAVFEINGSRRPNKQNEDVALFNANGLGSSCAIELDSGKCFGSVFSPTPLTYDECMAQKGELGIENCYLNYDYWAGAVKQCGGVNNMPTANDLAKIASAIYKGNPSVGATEDVTDLTYIAGTATSLGLPEPSFWLWSGEELGSTAYYRVFISSRTNWGNNDHGRSFVQAVCLTD